MRKVDCSARLGRLCAAAHAAAWAMLALTDAPARADPASSALDPLAPSSIRLVDAGTEVGTLLVHGLPVTGLVLVSFILGALYWQQKSRRSIEEVRELGSLLDVLDEGILVCDGMHIAAANLRIRRLAGRDEAALEGSLIGDLIHDIAAIDRLLGSGDISLETELTTSGGVAVAIEIAARTIQFAGRPHRLLEIRDIRERKASQARISFLAHHDPLTRLPNREVLHTRLDSAIRRADEAGRPCAILWIDLDRFKEINDVHGHELGDQLLCAVAEKLRFELPADALIARVGGDEFVVLYEGLEDSSEARLAGQQLRRLLNRPIVSGTRSLKVGASIGVAVYPDNAVDAASLLRNADLALYQAKSEGRGRYRHFAQELGRDLERRVRLSTDLQAAIANNEIMTYFQPVLRTSDGRISSFEALARWTHRDFGPVPPTEFIRIAEESGLIEGLTRRLLDEALAYARRWPEHIRVAVNISPTQIGSELVDLVRQRLQDSGFDPGRLELEVTESTLISDFERTSSIFARLRAIGVHVAMDDFGAGYTSMANLRRLNFDRIKIDRIFTADLPSHRRSAALVHSMLVLARELELDVTVEGVETVEQHTLLRSMGCGEVQGYLYSRPRPAEEGTAEAISEVETRVARQALEQSGVTTLPRPTRRPLRSVS